MPNSEDKKTIINCHTHLFTIDHVPNNFGRRAVPLLLQFITIRTIKWFYTNFTKWGNSPFNRRRKRWIKSFKKFENFLRKTIIGYWIYAALFFFLKWLFKIILNFLTFENLFSKKTRATIGRFLLMGRSAMYVNQAKNLERLKQSYPADTKFVVLPMDMEYMGAGEPAEDYLMQLHKLTKIKKNHPNKIIPFVGVDPRRIKATEHLNGNKNFETYTKHLIEKEGYAGIKLYPALGYFPFDESLISTFEYAQENELPLMTHCVAGVVYYRGKKKKIWNQHPILTYNNAPLELPEQDNAKFTASFTHPLNYHCLMDPELLKRHINRHVDLSNLKMCLAHFGGAAEWFKYFKDGKNPYNNNITNENNRGKTLNQMKNTFKHWDSGSWISIIYDMMLKYPNLYTDISFMLYEDQLFPLLCDILNYSPETVQKKILFGTDYYMVSQKADEKEIFQNLRGVLGKELFELIAVENPRNYLSSKLYKF